MNTKQRFLTILVLVMSIISSGCTSRHQFVCNITTENYAFNIVGESGEMTDSLNNQTNIQYSTSGEKVITVDVNEELKYGSSNNTYKIVGKITVDQTSNTVSYNLTATGGAFGNSPQICKKP